MMQSKVCLCVKEREWEELMFCKLSQAELYRNNTYLYWSGVTAWKRSPLIPASHPGLP